MRKFWRNVLWLITFSLFSESIFIAQAEASRVENLQKAQESFFEVYINGRDLNEVTMFLDMKQTIWVSHEKLLQWGLIVPPFQKGQHYQKRLYYPLSAVRDASYTIDRKKMAIHLVFSPTNFVPNTFDASKFNFSHPTKPGFGAFMNYDVLEREFTGLSSTNGFFAPGIFTPKGSLNSGFLAQRNHGIDVDNQNMVRLNTQWETDYPEKMKSLKAGDSFSTPGLWGNSVGFGGIQWGTNFATQPQFVTFPLPSASGIAVAPSTVDLYINNVLSNNKTVTTGPFTINAIPVVTGSGTVNVVTTDLLGRQQVVNLPYYASEELLKPGLHDYSFEAGFVRKNFGTESNDYGQFAAIGTDNIGITDKLTGQWHTELQRDQQNLGIGEDYLVGKVGILSSSVAVSRDAHSAGQLLLLGFQRQSFGGINYGVRMQATTDTFRQTGLEKDQHAPAFTSQVFLGVPLPRSASMGASYIQQNNRDTPHVGLISFSYSQSLFQKWSLNVSTVTTVSGPSNRAVFLTLTRALDDRTTLSVSGNRQTGTDQGSVQISRSLPSDTGWGYNLYGAGGSEANYQATVMGQNDVGTYTAGAAQQAGVRGYQAEARGGVVLLDDDIYFTRTLGNSFGVVKIPGYSHVRVYNHNQTVGYTNSKGDAFVSDLLPYQANNIKISSADLPINVSIKTTALEATPYNNSGLVIKFPVEESAQNGLVTLRQTTGKFVPAGATVNNLMGAASQAIVANEGEAYLVSLKKGENAFEVKWDDHRCYFTLHYSQTRDPLPNLGVINCKGKSNDTA